MGLAQLVSDTWLLAIALGVPALTALWVWRYVTRKEAEVRRYFKEQVVQQEKVWDRKLKAYEHVVTLTSKMRRHLDEVIGSNNPEQVETHHSRARTALRQLDEHMLEAKLYMRPEILSETEVMVEAHRNAVHNLVENGMLAKEELDELSMLSDVFVQQIQEEVGLDMVAMFKKS